MLQKHIGWILFLVMSMPLFAQEESLYRDKIVSPPYSFTAEEMDSVYAVAFDYFKNAEYEKILSRVPALAQNAKQVNEDVIATRLRSILGNTFIRLDDTESAENMFLEDLELAKKQQDTFKLLNSYINLGNVFLSNNTDQAIEYYEEAQRYLDNSGVGRLGKAIVHINLAELYVNRKEPGMAQHHLDLARSSMLFPELSNRHNEFESTSHHIQGSIYLLQGLPYRSIESTKKSLAVNHVTIDQDYVVRSYRNLINAYEQTGQYEELNQVRKLYDSVRDKRYAEERIKQQQIARSVYNVEKFEKELAESQFQAQLLTQKAEQDRKMMYVLCGVGLLLLILLGALLIIRSKRNRLLQVLKVKNSQYLEAKETSEKLARKNTKFLSTISHELRTPLYGIIGLSSVFLQDKRLKEYKEEFNSLKFSADYLLALVNDILNVNKYESRKGQELSVDHFNMHQLIDSIVHTFQFLNKKNNNKVEVEIDPNIPSVLKTDKTKLSQILMNLLSNASKFTQDGTITLSVQQKSNDGHEVELDFTVKDTGRGIEEQDQQAVFEEFTQVKGNFNEGGTGLGLPIVNKLLKILNSKLNMQSTYGKGTTFYFAVLMQVGSIRELEGPIADHDIKNLIGRKVLIVDDNKINQLVTQKILEQYQMTHDTVNNGQEAVEAAVSNNYDYILMDINMPVMNGIEATDTLRSKGVDTTIIALTAAADLNLERDIYSHGFDAILVKPYPNEELLELLVRHYSKDRIRNLEPVTDNAPASLAQ